MKRIPILTAVVAVCAFAVSCKHSGTSGLPIPKDALIVLDINTSSLSSKLSWKEIQQTTWFQSAHEGSDDTVARKLLDNPDASGIDLKSDLAYFIKKQGHGGYMAFEGKIKDASAFEAILKHTSKNTVTKKDGDLNYIETSSSSVVCWNDDKFFAMNDMPLAGMSPFSHGEEQTAFTTDSLRKFTHDLLALKSSDDINSDDHFSDLMKESGDAHFWVNSSQYTSTLGGGMLSALKMGSLLQGNVSTFTLNFDNGKIAIKTKQYYGEEMKKLLDKYKLRNVDAALVNRIPSQDVVGAMAVNMDPNTLREFFKASGVDGMANAYLSEMNYSLDELLNATGGQFLMSVTDMKMISKQVPNYYGDTTSGMRTVSSPDMNFLFATSVHDRGSFDKLIGIIQGKMGSMMTDKVTFKTTNDWFAVGNHPEIVDKFLAGGTTRQAFADKITGHPFGLYIDIQHVLKLQLQDPNRAAGADEMERTVLDASIAFWKDVVATGGEYSGGTSTGEININLVDGSTNSLKQLNQYADKIAVAAKANRQKMEERMKEQMNTPSGDTTAAPAAVAPEAN